MEGIYRDLSHIGTCGQPWSPFDLTNCAAGNLQIFLHEIIELQENGGSGGNLTQILYFPFYMGIASPYCTDVKTTGFSMP